jgi:hypothetical protein
MIPSHDRETVSRLLSRVLTQLLTWLMAGARYTRHINMGRGSGSITAAAIMRSVFMMSPLGKISFADLYSSFVIPVSRVASRALLCDAVVVVVDAF